MARRRSSAQFLHHTRLAQNRIDAYAALNVRRAQPRVGMAQLAGKLRRCPERTARTTRGRRRRRLGQNRRFCALIRK